MGNKVFKDRMGKPLKRGATYKKGDSYLDFRLVEDLVDRLLELKVYEGDSNFGLMLAHCNMQEEMEEELKSYVTEKVPSLLTEEVDSQAFLDAVVMKIAMEGADIHFTRGQRCLLSPLITVLYKRGDNDLSLDMRYFPEMPDWVAEGLQGTEDEKLSLTVRVPEPPEGSKATSDVGKGNSHCKIHLLSSGDNVGVGSKDGEYIIERPVRKIGNGAYSCIFRLANVFYADLDEESWPVIPIAGGGKRTKSQYKFNAQWKQGLSETILDGEFFERGNRLYVQKREGGWKEVRPK